MSMTRAWTKDARRSGDAAQYEQVSLVMRLACQHKIPVVRAAQALA